ncbi:MAG TPA: GNAT family N-acetyltransferase [Acidimicrobiales bacterium]|nr:GNAT family N-acetyltransferase [Acidimicrobiales bacterium]
MPISYRAMTHDDVTRVNEVWKAAIMPQMISRDQPSRSRSNREEEAALARFHHLVSTDPKGVFVATDNTEIIGICQSLRRGGIFVLSRLGIAPDHQEQGIGRELLSLALAYADESDEQYIFTSLDPRAIHTYVREGFTLNPCVRLWGHNGDSDLPASIRTGNRSDLDLIDAIDQKQRGVSRRKDLELWLQFESRVLIDDEGGYLLFDDNRLISLCAQSIQIADRLLSTALRGALGNMPLEAAWIVKEQQWAITAAMRSRATIEVHGAMLTKNVRDFVVPYLPNASLG